MKKIFASLAGLMLLITAVAVQGTEAGKTNPTKTSTDTADARTLSESLIYSVNRTPERPFETARAVQVITGEELRRKMPLSLADALFEQTGLYFQQVNYSGGMPIIRGLFGKQVLILVDGVKMNNATWRRESKEYINLIDVSQVERVEIVRGVVSVLGTEALGGVINIITKKGPLGSESFAGTVGARYGSADGSVSAPISAFGQGDRYRFAAGISYTASKDVQGGSGLGRQDHTAYTQRAGHLHLDYFVSAERTLSFSFQRLGQYGVERAQNLADKTNLQFDESPLNMQASSVSYQDVTNRRWADTLRLTAYWNQQKEGRDEIRTRTPTVENHLRDSDTLFGSSLEMGKFLGSHHLIYGIDFTSESLDSKRTNHNLTSGALTPARGRYTDGASYRTSGIYLNDRFDIGRRLNVSAGLRYGIFSASGSENTSVGTISLDQQKSDVTGSLNVVYHVTDKLNVVGNAMRGFRAPNLDDISKYSESRDAVDVPNPSAEAEHVMSYEGGLKYEGERFSGSAFYYRNDLTNLLIRTAGTFNGLSFIDTNKNGTRDAGELPVMQTLNVGKATIDGYELDGRYTAPRSFVLFVNYTKTTGTDTTVNDPLRIAPAFGTAGVRFAPNVVRQPWAELVCQFARSQHRLSKEDIADFRIGPNGTPGYRVFNLRGGFDLGEDFRVGLGVENLTNEDYKYHGSFVHRPGRNFVMSTQYRF